MKYPKILLVMLAGLLALSGCSAKTGNNAAIIGSERISVTALENIYQVAIQDQVLFPNPKEIPASGAQATLFKASLLSILVNGEVAKQLLTQNGMKLDSVTLAQTIANNPSLARLNANAELKPVLESIALSQIASTTLRPEAMQVALAKIKVEVNPRYGDWAAQGEPNQNNLLSVLAAPDNGSLQGLPPGSKNQPAEVSATDSPNSTNPSAKPRK